MRTKLRLKSGAIDLIEGMNPKEERRNAESKMSIIFWGHLPKERRRKYLNSQKNKLRVERVNILKFVDCTFVRVVLRKTIRINRVKV